MWGSDRSIFHSRVLPGDQVEFIYFDGRREIKSIAEVNAAAEAKAAKDRAEFQKFETKFFAEEFGTTKDEFQEAFREEIRDAISITHMPIELGFDDEVDDFEPVDEAEELDAHHEEVEEKLEADLDLQQLAQALDLLQEHGTDSAAAQMANDYITLHGMGLPLFELYTIDEQSIRRDEKLGEVFLGYRTSAAQAAIVPNDRYNEDDELGKWVDDLHELRRILWIVTDRDEMYDDWGITSETTRWLWHAHVNNGRIIRGGPQRTAWERVVDPAYKNDGVVYSPIMDVATPLLMCTEFATQEAMTVSAWMQRTRRQGTRSDKAQRWQTLLNIIANDFKWTEFEGSFPEEKHLLICVNGTAFDQQLVAYWLTDQDLPMPPKRYGSPGESEWKYPSDHQPLRTWWRDNWSDEDDDYEDDED